MTNEAQEGYLHKYDTSYPLGIKEECIRIQCNCGWSASWHGLDPHRMEKLIAMHKETTGETTNAKS